MLWLWVLADGMYLFLSFFFARGSSRVSRVYSGGSKTKRMTRHKNSEQHPGTLNDVAAHLNRLERFFFYDPAQLAGIG